MDATQKRDYDQYLESLRASDSAIETAKYEVRLEKTTQVIVNSYKKGLSIELIAEIVSVSEEEVRKILQEKELL